ncbi:MAG: shikimate dehydrogenase [Breznakibacter sp.]|nr:shikimate dehydrogenase [Breznakibacter sp.]
MKTFGLIGFPLKQSFSQKYFTQKFQDLHIEAEYENYSIASIEVLEEILREKDSLKGFNVTIPYKKQVLAYLDELDDIAKEVGAVNVVKISTINGKKHLKGYNSDIIGFENSLIKYLKPQHKKALILGTGGASLAVEYALKRLGIEYRYVSRSSSSSDILTYEQITPNVIAEYTLIINTTPLGMFPDIESSPNIPYHLLTNDHLLYDLVYNPEKTKFMQQGELNGAVAVNGLEMLYGQAEEAWRIWNS